MARVKLRYLVVIPAIAVLTILAFLVSMLSDPPAAPSVLNYSLELATIVLGYSLIVLLVLTKYQESQ